MSNTDATSGSERKALAYFATLPFRIVPTQTFAPLLSIYHHDGDGDQNEGRPDALCTQPLAATYIESKSGGTALNDHRSKASSHRALQAEYTSRTYDLRPQTYNFLTDFFNRTDRPFLLRHAWNQSLWKVLALQRLHGFLQYIVVFAANPRAADAERYARAGLVFCTEKSVTQLLTVIEFAASGFYYPFFLRAERSGYAVVVNPAPDPAYADLTPEQTAAAERTKYLAAMDAQDAADAAKLLPCGLPF